jgi:hypothetical protein
MLVIGSRVEIGSSRFRLFRADVAQLVEHSLGKGEVISSILIIGSRLSGSCGRERDEVERESAGEIPSVARDLKAGVTQW